MAKVIRQNATHKVVVGPFLAVADGFTPVTNITLSGADEKAAILHDNGTIVSISAYTWAAITSADGYYHLTLQSGITGTVGHLTIVVQDDSACLPVREDFIVVEEAVYDLLFAASADPTTLIADGVLARDIGSGTGAGSSQERTVRSALRFLRNKWSVAGDSPPVLTVTKEDDSTTAWTSNLTTATSSTVVTTSDPN